MAQDLLTKESPEIIRFFQDIEYLTRFLDSEQDRYRPVLNGERYITEAELAEIDVYAQDANINIWAASAERQGPTRK